jgi:hypothetical protein
MQIIGHFGDTGKTAHQDGLLASARFMRGAHYSDAALLNDLPCRQGVGLQSPLISGGLLDAGRNALGIKPVNEKAQSNPAGRGMTLSPLLNGYISLRPRVRAIASKPISAKPPPEVKLLRSQLGPEQGTTWASTPATSTLPATTAAVPPIHSGIRFRPTDASTQQPATNNAGPASIHNTPQPANAAPTDRHSRMILYPPVDTAYPKKSIPAATRSATVIRTAFCACVSMRANLRLFLS